MHGYRPDSILESWRLSSMLRTAVNGLDMQVVFLKHERLAAFLQNRAAERFQLQMLIEAETLPDIQAARNSTVLAERAWEVTVAQLGAQDATNASVVTIFVHPEHTNRTFDKTKARGRLRWSRSQQTRLQQRWLRIQRIPVAARIFRRRIRERRTERRRQLRRRRWRPAVLTPAQQAPAAAMAADVPTLCLLQPYFPE